MATTHEGVMGRAELIPVPENDPRGAETVAAWLVTAPCWSPLLPVPGAWTQWLLGCVRLRDGVPGFPPPRRKFPGATHEIHVMSLNPDHGPYSAEDFWTSGRVAFLEPQNVVLQFTAADAEMREVTDLAARAVVDGVLCPESWHWPGGNQPLTEAWRVSITKTLAHIRGEVHAR